MCYSTKVHQSQDFPPVRIDYFRAMGVLSRAMAAFSGRATLNSPAKDTLIYGVMRTALSQLESTNPTIAQDAGYTRAIGDLS